MKQIVLIGDWSLSLTSGELINVHDASRRKVLTHKPLLFVKTLCSGQGEVVPKQEIIEKVWGGFTSPENITQVVNKLRVTFEDKNKDIFVNFPGIGYALVFRFLSTEVHTPVLSDARDKAVDASISSPLPQPAPIANTNNRLVNKSNSLYMLFKFTSYLIFCLTVIFVLIKEGNRMSVERAVLNLETIGIEKISTSSCILNVEDKVLFCES